MIWISSVKADDASTKELLNIVANCKSVGGYDRLPELISKGADVNAYACCKYSPARLGGNRIILAPEQSCNSNLYTPIQHLLRSERIDDDIAVKAMHLLVTAGADPNKLENVGIGRNGSAFPFTRYGLLSSGRVNASNVEKKVALLKELVDAGMVIKRMDGLGPLSVGIMENYPKPFYDYLYSVSTPEFKKQMEEALAAGQERIRSSQEKESARIAQEKGKEAARVAQQVQDRKSREARDAQERLSQQQRDADAAKFRKKLAVGDETHCGMVIERKDPIVKIQTMAGEKWLRTNRIFPPGAHGCRFYNGQYED
jgi:hypothetical protein